MLKKFDFDCDCCMDFLKKASKWFWLIWGIASISYLLKALFTEDKAESRHYTVMGMLYGIMFGVASNKCTCGDGCTCECDCEDCNCNNCECEE